MASEREEDMEVDGKLKPQQNFDAVSICSSVYNDLQDEEPKKTGQRVSVLCFVGSARENEELKTIVRDKLDMDVIESKSGSDYEDLSEGAFVLNDFYSHEFRYIQARQQKILGPTAVYEYAKTNYPIPSKKKNRPMYCSSMKDIVVCLTGLRNKSKITELVDLVHWMGGSVRKEYTKNVTHLIADTTQSEKYRLAISMGKPVLGVQWIEELWQKRGTPFTSAITPEMLKKHQLPAFYKLRILFKGEYSKEETQDMHEVATTHGASLALDYDEETTHIVTDSPTGLPLKDNNGTLYTCNIVRTEWFWVSVQLDVCARESLYQAGDTTESSVSRRSKRSPHLKTSRKSGIRKCGGLEKERRGSMGDSSMGMDASSDVSGLMSAEIFSTEDFDSVLAASPRKEMSKRQQVCMELLQTEKNYVEVLKTILTLYKEPLEKAFHPGAGLESQGGTGEAEGNTVFVAEPLISKIEHQLIFGKIQAIYETHKGIYNDLSALIAHWSDHWCIGTVWIKHLVALEKCYPPFVNSFDTTKETLQKLDRTKMKFHAFLKLCQTKPESHRQGLEELLIRPVQRLPSVLLLLTDILKRTDKNTKVHSKLVQGIDGIKRVLTQINQKKDTTEECYRLLNIFNGIEGYPADQIDSRRQLLSKIDVEFCTKDVPIVGLNKLKGKHLSLFLFNDFLEVTKRRDFAEPVYNHTPKSASKRLPHTPKGRFEMGSSKGRKQPYKHALTLLPFDIRRVRCVPEADRVFILTLRTEIEDVETVFQTNGIDATSDKETFLKNLAAVIKNSTGRDIDLLDYSLLQESSRDGKDSLYMTIEKIASQSQSIGRRFSLTRTSSFGTNTPGSSGTLKRAVSHAAMTTMRGLRRGGASLLRLGNQSNLNNSTIREEDSPTQSPEHKFTRPSIPSDFKRPTSASVRPRPTEQIKENRRGRVHSTGEMKLNGVSQV